MYRIVFIGGKLKGRKLTVHHGAVRLGRAADCSIRLSDRTVADRHAIIEERDRRVYIRNLDPVGGTLVNGQKIIGAAEPELADRDEVCIGDTRFRVERAEFAKIAPHRRRIGFVQTLAYAGIVVVVAAEAVLVAYFAAMRDTPVPVPLETAVTAPPDAAPESSAAAPKPAAPDATPPDEPMAVPAEDLPPVMMPPGA